MTIRYLDPVNGNDANDGLSFANRKRTLGALTTSAVNGDDIRVIASPDPFSVGSGTWTDNTSSVAFTNSSNTLVDACEAGWVGSTNVTVTYPTSRKTGATSMSCAIAAAFTTGKAAYKTLPAPLTLSAFRQLAFYFMTSSTSSTVMDFKIALCSDTTGDTIVGEVNVVLTASDITASVWKPLVLDSGANFDGTDINSIAIHINADPSTSASRTFSFDSFSTCKAPGAADLIDLFSLVGKNTVGEPEWYPVWGLSETGVTIGAHRSSTLLTDPPRPYRGVTEAVTTHILNPLVPTPWSDADGQINRNLLNITGGWNRTDMSTQTGETWLSGAYNNKGFSGTISGNTANHVINIGFAHCTAAFNSATVGHSAPNRTAKYDLLGIIGCETPISYYANNMGYYELICPQIWGHWNGLTLPFIQSSGLPGFVDIARIHGYTETSPGEAAYQPPPIAKNYPPVVRIGKIDNCTFGYLLSDRAYHHLVGTVFENAAIYVQNNSPYPVVELILDDMEDLYMTDSSFRAGMSSYGRTLVQNRIGGDPTLNRTVAYGRTLFESNTTVRHTASGLSWRLYVLTGDQIFVHSKQGAHRFPMAYAAVEGGAEVTVSCWVYQDSLAGTSRFGIMHERIDFMDLSLNQVDADPGTLNAWQEVILTFTPTASGVVPIYAYGYGNGVSPSAYFDDVTITQGAV